MRVVWGIFRSSDGTGEFEETYPVLINGFY
jgi:hypothetical protein